MCDCTIQDINTPMTEAQLEKLINMLDNLLSGVCSVDEDSNAGR